MNLVDWHNRRKGLCVLSSVCELPALLACKPKPTYEVLRRHYRCTAVVQADRRCCPCRNNKRTDTGPRLKTFPFSVGSVLKWFGFPMTKRSTSVRAYSPRLVGHTTRHYFEYLLLYLPLLQLLSWIAFHFKNNTKYFGSSCGEKRHGVKYIHESFPCAPGYEGALGHSSTRKKIERREGKGSHHDPQYSCIY